MQILLVFLFAVLAIITFLIIKFMQGEEKDKKTKLSQTNDMIADLESKLKRVQEELGKELAAKEEVENILYKTKDEADNAKNAKNELEQKIKDLTKDKDDFAKKVEVSKQEGVEKQKLQSEWELAKKEAEEARKQKENLERELTPLKSDLSKKDESLKQLSEEREKFKSEAALAKKEMEQLKAQARPVDVKKIEAEKEALQKENDELKNKLKFLEEIHEGFKGQYDELSQQLEGMIKQKIKGFDSEASGEGIEKGSAQTSAKAPGKNQADDTTQKAPAPQTGAPAPEVKKEKDASAKKASFGQEQKNPQTGSPENSPDFSP